MIDTEKNISLLNSDRNAVAKANIKELTFPNQKGNRYQIESVINARSDGKYVYINGSNPYHQGIVFVLDMSLKEKTAFLAGEGVILKALWNEQVQFFDAQSRILYRYDEETNEVASAAIDALQEIEYIKPMKNAYKMIILEEAQEYFVGNRDIDAVCAAIENRLRLALEEKKKE